MIENSSCNFSKVLCVLKNQWDYCMMSLDVQWVSLIHGPGKAERELIYFTPQKCITKRISNQYKTSLISFQHWFFKFDSAFSTFVLYSAETTHPIFLKWFINKIIELDAWIFLWWTTLYQLPVSFWQKK